MNFPEVVCKMESLSVTLPLNVILVDVTAAINNVEACMVFRHGELSVTVYDREVDSDLQRLFAIPASLNARCCRDR